MPIINHKEVWIKTYVDKVVPCLFQKDPAYYVNFYKAHMQGENMIYVPWACMPITKFDTAALDGELVELDRFEVINRSKAWARKHLGAKFVHDENTDGTSVSPFEVPNSSANCIIAFEPFPFYSCRTNE